MDILDFYANFDNVQKHVTVSHSFGGPDSLSIHIDNYYQGNMVYRDGHWMAWLNDRSLLTSADIFILGEMIENKIAR